MAKNTHCVFLFWSGCTVGHRAQIQGSLCPLSITPSGGSEGSRVSRGELWPWTHADRCGFAQGTDPWLQAAGQLEDLQTRWEERPKDPVKQIKSSPLRYFLLNIRMFFAGYPDHMVFSEFRRRFDVLAPHLTKKLGRNYIVKDEKRVSSYLRE